MAALPVEGAERCAVSRAAGRRARRSTGQATAIVLRSARLGRFHLLSSSLTCPSDRRRLCRLRFVGVGAAIADAHSSAPRPRGRDSRAGSRLRQRWRDRQPRPGLSPFASRRPADLPASPSAPHLRCPGAVASCRSAHGSASASAAHSPWRRIRCQSSGFACDASVRRPVGSPPALRSRRRGSGGSPSTRTKARRSRRASRAAARRNRGALATGAPVPEPIHPAAASSRDHAG
jgi:hypothetical protein